MATRTPIPNPRPPDDTSVLQPHGWPQKLLIWIISATTPKCREVVRILSEQMDRELSLVTRCRLRLHFVACCWCERYMKQLHYLRETARRFPEHADEGAGGAALSPEARLRLKQTLNNS
jgi:hypothetical protein